MKTELSIEISGEKQKKRNFFRESFASGVQPPFLLKEIE